MKPARLPKDVLERKARELWDEGLSAAAVGKRLGVSKSTISGIAYRKAFPSRPRAVASLDPDKRQAIVAAATANPARTAREIGAEVGASRTTVHSVLSADLAGWAEAHRAQIEARMPLGQKRKAKPVPPGDALLAVPGARGRHKRLIPETAPTASLACTDPLADPDDHGGRYIPTPSTGCQWPIGAVGTKAFRFCGARKDEGRWPYCFEHHRLAVRPRDSSREAQAA